MEVSISSPFQDKLRRGEVASTLVIKMIRTNEIIMIAKTAGYEAIFIDMEHSSIDLESTSQLCLAALCAGITPIVRSPSKEPFFVSRILDGGALAVVVPHIKTIQDVKDAVHAAKFGPIGSRSMSSGLPHFQFRQVPTNVATSVCNDVTMVIPMIETVEAVELIDEIAAVKGVDSLLIGANDMTAELGISEQYEDPRFIDIVRRTIAACERNGIYCGLGGLNSRLDLIEKFCGMGARWVMAGADFGMLLAAAKKRGTEMKDVNARVMAETQKSAPAKNVLESTKSV